MDTLVYLGRRISKQASCIHGITDDQVVGASAIPMRSYPCTDSLRTRCLWRTTRKSMSAS